MNTIYLSLMTLLFSSFGFAQNETISGKITNSKNQPLERAYVLVLDADDHSYITGTVTDENGNYEVNLTEEGTFLLTADHVSFEEPKRIGVLNNESNLNDDEFIQHKQLYKISNQETANVEEFYPTYEVSLK